MSNDSEDGDSPSALDELFVAGATLHEPSAAERARAQREWLKRKRRSRWSRRMHSPLGRSQARIQSSSHSRSGRIRSLGPVLVFLGLFAVVWTVSNSGGSDSKPVEVGSADRPAPRPESSTPLGRPAPVPSGDGTFETSAHQPGHPETPVAFDPCRPIHYVVNLDGAPIDGLSLIREAFARVHTATGLRFIDDGATTETPSKDRAGYQPRRYGPNAWAPVLIAWTDEAAYPSLSGYISGVGGPIADYTSGGKGVYVSGEVVLDREQLSAVAAPDRGQVRAAILHELGHLVGLDHTADRRQIMFSEAEFNVRDYADGDQRGLAKLGTQACFPEI